MLQVPLKPFNVCTVTLCEQEDIFLVTIAGCHQHIYITAYIENLVQVSRHIKSIRFSLARSSLRLPYDTAVVTDPWCVFSGRLNPRESGYNPFIPAHSWGSYSVSTPPTYLQSCVTLLVESSALAWNISSFALSPHRLRFMIVVVVVRAVGWQKGKQCW